ncbi:MAG: GAF domain-containing sensor histidine kinase [Bradyrhizobium sp.]|nr:GAF domain-containing sensor histidine kinase [Bradyrhizobium sp.]
MAEISEWPENPGRLASLTRSLQILFQCNRLLFEASGEHELLHAICQTLIEVGELRLAWIGYCGDDAERNVRPLAMAGYGLDFLDCVKFSWGDTEAGQSPTGVAIRSGQPCLVKDIHTNPHFSHGRTQAIARGYASCLAVPLMAGGKSQATLDLRGTLNLYSDRHDFFDRSAIELYANLGSYLAYAVTRLRSTWAQSFTSEVTVLRNKRERNRAEAALRASELERYLMKAERLSGLGGLVAGVAHELSTPIGTSLTVASSLMRRCSEFDAEMTTGQLRRSRLAAFINDNLDGAGQLVAELERASGLIQSFNQVAVDRSGANRRAFNLKLATEQIISSLQPSLRRTQLSLAIEIPDRIIMDSYPGPYGQALTDLITNAAVHAFADAQDGHILIEARSLDEEQVEIILSDNGEGMAADVLQHAFDPFFTTRRSHGHAGLGLFIVYNIVTQQLGGHIMLSSVPAKGTTFRIKVPMTAPRDGRPFDNARWN